MPRALGMSWAFCMVAAHVTSSWLPGAFRSCTAVAIGRLALLQDLSSVLGWTFSFKTGLLLEFMVFPSTSLCHEVDDGNSPSSHLP